MEVRLFDLETDGLLDTVSKIHLIVIKDPSSKERWVYRKNLLMDTIPEGVEMLRACAAVGMRLVAHNGIGFDYAVLAKLTGLVIPWQQAWDSMVLATLAWPELKGVDMDLRKKKKTSALRDMPGNLIGSYSLEAFGWRVGQHKGDYRGDTSITDEAERFKRRWEAWNPDMEAYGIGDVEVLDELWTRIQSKELSEESCWIETQVAHILARQERYGFLFDEAAAVKLYTTLVARKLELEAEVKLVFKPRFLPAGAFTPAKDSKAYGYQAGAPMTKVKLTEFNPTSRDHVSFWLKKEYGWEPTEFTNDGKPKVDDEVISKLPYAEAKPLKEYFMVVKRIGQIAEGKEAWLKKVGRDGRMRGRVHPNRAVTGRMAHSNPNMGQVPATYSPYGKECRACFIASSGKVLVGIDADALENRDLAGFLARYDGGAYVQSIVSGSKADGTDSHSVNARVFGMDPKAKYFGDETGRDVAKTLLYAMVYGGGDEKLGFIRYRFKGPKAAAAGKQLRADFMRGVPAFEKLVKAVKNVAKERGYLLGMDKRRLVVRSQHAALNTLLQSAGAIQMKKAQCLADDAFQQAGLIPGVHYEFVATVHDEWQLEVDTQHAQTVLELGKDAIRLAGIHFQFLCPLAGSGSTGRNWAETH